MLSIAGLSRHFQLRVTETSSRERGGIRHDKRTILEETDDNGQVIRPVPITEGALYETFD